MPCRPDDQGRRSECNPLRANDADVAHDIVETQQDFCNHEASKGRHGMSSINRRASQSNISAP